MFVETIDDQYDVVVVGTGFGSLFFAEKFIRGRPRARILLLEWGEHHTHRWQLEHGRNSPIAPATTFDGSSSSKPWYFTIGLGGGANCWYAQTPRMHPADFKTRSSYGIGHDWPISYEDLEPHYTNVEYRMAVSGSDGMGRVLPRSRPFPQPPHRPSSVDRVMLAAQPDLHFIMPTARARIPTRSRPACCASARCSLCPIDAKFSANNGFRTLFDNPNVEILLGAEVVSLQSDSSSVLRAEFLQGGRQRSVAGDLFVLGANAIHSPAILLRSGILGPVTGRGLHEQIGYEFEVMLHALDNFDGSTITTGINYGLYDGPFRKDHAGTLLYFENRMKFGLRKEYGRWRESLPIVAVSEDLPNDDSRVSVNEDGFVQIHYERHSAYAERGRLACLRRLESVLAPLPVERIVYKGMRPTEAHLQGTLRMGSNRVNSEVDAGQVHHRLRNLVVVGSSVFPACSNANPSLTVAALSDRAAELIS